MRPVRIFCIWSRDSRQHFRRGRLFVALVRPYSFYSIIYYCFGFGFVSMRSEEFAVCRPKLQRTICDDDDDGDVRLMRLHEIFTCARKCVMYYVFYYCYELAHAVRQYNYQYSAQLFSCRFCIYIGRGRSLALASMAGVRARAPTVLCLSLSLSLCTQHQLK